MHGSQKNLQAGSATGAAQLAPTTESSPKTSNGSKLPKPVSDSRSTSASGRLGLGASLLCPGPCARVVLGANPL
jgi:hypothetical protein